jgi:ribokinase
MNVGTDGIEIIEGIPTGVAGIVVAENDNSIIVIPGSNNMVTKEVIDKHRDIILSSDMVLLQLEIPMETVEYTAKLCSENNIKVILNPAPAAELSTNLIEDSTYITPNEHELGIIAGKFNDMDEALREYPNKMIVTLGSKGVKYFDGIEIKSIPAYPANVVDTTGAGDTFCGALAASLVEGNGLEDSVKFANKAAALATTKLGAQSGMPAIEEMEKFN